MAGASRNGVAGRKQVKRAKRKAEDSDNEAYDSKKVKLSKSGASKPDLSQFKGVPMDLLPNIFQHLSPSDLVNFCDASFIFWNALCRSSEARIWKYCRENHDVYEIPDGMNEYHWAKLLFGSRCMECGAGNVRMADFYLRRRICNKCRGDKCIDVRRDKMTNFSRDAFDCSPVTHISSTGSKASLNKVYWRAEVAEQHKKLAALENNVDLDLPGATRALEEYKISRRKLIRTIRSEATDFEEYQRKWLEKVKQETVDPFQVRYDEITRRFVELGYSPRDFPPAMKMHKLVRLKTGITPKAWQSIVDTFEGVIKANKQAREQKKWAELKVGRRRTLDTVYASYLFSNVHHSLWTSMPQVHTLCTLQPFDDLITCDMSRTITEADFAPLMARLDEILDTAYEEVKKRLHQRILIATDPFLVKLATTQPFQNLELATIVFRCSHCNTLIFGLADVRMHDCADANHQLSTRWELNTVTDEETFSDEFPYTYAFEEGGAHAARMVIEALGQDPKTVTPSQLDEMNKRLYCGCHLSGVGFRQERAYMWRSLVTHILQEHRKDHEFMTMKHPEVVPETCIPSIKKEEDWVNEQGDFSCMHCDNHLRGRRMHDRGYTHVKTHLRIEHAILRPELGADYISLSNHKQVVRWFNDGILHHPSILVRIKAMGR